MHSFQNFGRRAFALLLVTVLLCGGVLAAEIQAEQSSVYCFSEEDFSESEAVDGIYVVSSPAACDLRCGLRQISTGDILSRDALSMLTLSGSSADGSTEIRFRPIVDGMLEAEQSITVSMFSKKKTVPVCEDGELETYKNIVRIGTLCACDEDGDRLTYQLVRQPKRGTVELHEDGSFTYTPGENKVGKDWFTFTATDPDGQISNEATVKIKIIKPTDAAIYADVDKETAHTAMWLKEEGIYTGRTISGNLCFEPEGSVSRGEFLVMTMKLLGAEAEDTVLTSGFADEQATPQWMRPYLVSAFRNGMISGTAEESGIVFRPGEALTRAEAAVMLQNVLNLPVPETKTVFSSEDNAVPVWAQEAVSALWEAGMQLSQENADQPITRRECADLLYRIYQLMQSEDAPTFLWTK